MRRSRVAAMAVVLLASTGGWGAPPDPPRWRAHLGVGVGAGGALVDGRVVAAFPARLDLALRLGGPLSIEVGGAAILSAVHEAGCGGRRPHALLGTLGLRLDLGNRRSASWVVPFLEAHASVGAQVARPGAAGGCGPAAVFAGGGGRAGIDVWLGRSAVTVAASFDRLPTASSLALGLGWARAF